MPKGRDKNVSNLKPENKSRDSTLKLSKLSNVLNKSESSSRLNSAKNNSELNLCGLLNKKPMNKG